MTTDPALEALRNCDHEGNSQDVYPAARRCLDCGAWGDDAADEIDWEQPVLVEAALTAAPAIDYPPHVSVDEESTLVELRISPTRFFRIEIEPDGQFEFDYDSNDVASADVMENYRKYTAAPAPEPPAASIAEEPVCDNATWSAYSDKPCKPGDEVLLCFQHGGKFQPTGGAS